MDDGPTNPGIKKPTNQQTDMRVHRVVAFPIKISRLMMILQMEGEYPVLEESEDEEEEPPLAINNSLDNNSITTP